MSEKKGIAEELVEATWKEAVGQTAKWVVRVLLVAAPTTTVAAVLTLWSKNQAATVALLVSSLAVGFAIGVIVGSRNARMKMEGEIQSIRSAHEGEVNNLKEKINELEYDGMTPERAAKIIPNLIVDELSAVGWLIERYGNGTLIGLPSHLASVFRILVKKGVAVEAGGDTFSLTPGTVEALRGSDELMCLVKEAMLHVNYDERGNRHEVPRQVREKVMSETQSN